MLYGGQDNDLLIGGVGMDILSGDKGADRFGFGAEPVKAEDADIIADFTSSEDHIVLKGSTFDLAVGALDADVFVSSADGAALDENDRILYNTTTGVLSFDADGSGAGAAVELARLENKSELKADDFMIVSGFNV